MNKLRMLPLTANDSADHTLHGLGGSPIHLQGELERDVVALLIVVDLAGTY